MNARTAAETSVLVGAWEGRAGLAHGFLGRCAGPPWEPVLARLGLEGVPLLRPRQVHGSTVIVVGESEAPETIGDADGLLCVSGDRLLGVVTADCVPVLLISPGRRVAGVLHVGWRGAAAGIVPVALARLRSELGIEPGEIEVALGPSIDGCCYEVGREVREVLVRRYGDQAGAWDRSGLKWRLDLRLLTRATLEGGGVSPRSIHRVGPCTACAVDRFCSHRREGSAVGRQLSFVGWVSRLPGSSGRRRA